MADLIFSSNSYSFTLHTVPPLVTALTTLFVGIFVIVRERGSRVSILFLIYALTAFLWLFAFAMARSSQLDQVVFWWARTAHAGLALLPAALYHFTVFVLQVHGNRNRSVKVAWALGMFFLLQVLFTDAIFDGLYRYPWGPFTKYKWSTVPFVVYFFSAMVAILHLYWSEFRRSAKKSTQHRRARALLIAFGIGYLGALDFLPTTGVAYYPLGSFPMFVMLVLITRVIWHYRLVDITPAFAAHQIIDTMSDALLVLDNEGVIRVTNRASASLFGRSEQEMTGKPVSTIIRDPIFSTHIEQVKGSGDLENFEIAFCPCRNNTVILSLSASLLRDRSGQPAGIVCVARDITDMKKTEDERLKSQKLESLGVLAGGIAHDFNNLLTGVLGNLSLAREIVKQEEVAVRLVEAEKASLWARDLTQQLLAFSRGGAPVKKPVTLGALIKDAAGPALAGARTGAELRIPDDLWAVNADEGQIRQVIHNLIINADQAMPQGGIIEVSCENVLIGPGDVLPIKEGKYVRVTIEDNGIGIPKEHLQKIFDPYFTTKQKGSGLGLATAYAIIKNHGGFVGVESQPGAGSVFRVYLAASEHVPAGARGQGKKNLAGKGRILIMDDEKFLLDVAGQILQHLGYDIEAANDGSEAIQKYKAARDSGLPFNIVILDLTVPGGMGGKETIRRLRELDPRVKAIVSSGYSQDPVMSEFERYGFAGVVPKPYNIDGLGDAVQKAMGM